MCAVNEVFKWSNKEPMHGVDGSKNLIKDEEVRRRIVVHGINGSKNINIDERVHGRIDVTPMGEEENGGEGYVCEFTKGAPGATFYTHGKCLESHK